MMPSLLSPVQGFADTCLAPGRTCAHMLGMPFDAARQAYASAVQAGLIERSLISWARFERRLSSLESLTLGPWSRHV